MSSEDFQTFRFTHIPKCGGTSFREYINNNAIKSGIPKSQIYIPGCNNLSNDKNLSQLDNNELEALRSKEIKVFAGHMKHQEFQSKNISLNTPFNVTILRDPVERFVSHYNFFNYKLGYNNLKGMSLNDLDDNKRKWIIDRLSNIQTNYIADIKNIRAVGNDNILKIAKYNLNFEYQIVGILENVDLFLDALKSTELDWIQFSSEFPYKNKGKQYFQISDSVIDEIKEANHLDIELYEFAKNIVLS